MSDAISTPERPRVVALELELDEPAVVVKLNLGCRIEYIDCPNLLRRLGKPESAYDDFA